MPKGHKRKALLSITLSTFLATELAILPLTPLTVQASMEKATSSLTDSIENEKYENPSYDEINKKIEKIAQEMEIPSVLLKALAFRESTWRQFDSKGQPLLGANKSHPAIGIMQVATYNDNDLETIEKLKYDIDYNIRKGAELFDEKWQFTPRIGDGDRNKLENWYFSLWAYNIWSERNNPNVIAQALEDAEKRERAENAEELENSDLLADQKKQDGQEDQDDQDDIENEEGKDNDKDSNKDEDNTPKVILPKIAYQDSILEILAEPEGFLKRYIDPVEITKIPAEKLPESGIPSKNVKWTTPTPFHYGDLDEEYDDGEIDDIDKEEFSFTRLSGANRIDTAIEQALYGWPQGADAVVLARSDNFPDALAGVPLAAKLDAPILLTSSDTLDTKVKETIKTLNPAKVYLLGGEGALSPNISRELKNLGWDQNKQIRLDGLNRYDTAAQIALNVTNNKRAEAVFIVTGHNFTDALSIASIAGAQKIPMLLTNTKSLPEETQTALKSLNPKKVYIISNNEELSNIKLDPQEIKTLLNLPSSKVISLKGNSRYETMAAVIEHFDQQTSGLSFATGQDFPDALAGAALAAKNNTILTLIPQISIEKYPSLKTAIEQYPNKTDAESYIFGGTDAVSAEREKELLKLIRE